MCLSPTCSSSPPLGLIQTMGRESTSDLLEGMEHQLFDQICHCFTRYKGVAAFGEDTGAQAENVGTMEVFEQVKSINTNLNPNISL